MAKSITQNGITFSNYNNTDVTPVSLTVRLGTTEGLDEDNFGIVNAADIAWNGAVLPSSNTTINTTGQLLNLINSMSSQISTLNEQVYALGAAVIAIGSNPALQTN